MTPRPGMMGNPASARHISCTFRGTVLDIIELFMCKLGSTSIHTKKNTEPSEQPIDPLTILLRA
jgi:hypothetical protein